MSTTRQFVNLDEVSTTAVIQGTPNAGQAFSLSLITDREDTFKNYWKLHKHNMVNYVETFNPVNNQIISPSSITDMVRIDPSSVRNAVSLNLSGSGITNGKTIFVIFGHAGGGSSTILTNFNWAYSGLIAEPGSLPTTINNGDRFIFVYDISGKFLRLGT